MIGRRAVQHLSLRAKGWMSAKSFRIYFHCSPRPISESRSPLVREGPVKECFMRLSYGPRLTLLLVLAILTGVQPSHAAGIVHGVVSDPLGARVPAAIVT